MRLKSRKLTEVGNSLFVNLGMKIKKMYGLRKGTELDLNLIQSSLEEFTIKFSFSNKTLLERDVKKLDEIFESNPMLTEKHKPAIFKMFNPHGLNRALMQGRLEKAFLYRSKRDETK